MISYERVAQNLANAFLAGPWTAEYLARRGRRALRRRVGRWMAALVARVLQRFPVPARIPPGGLVNFLRGDTGLRRALTLEQSRGHCSEDVLYCAPHVMAPHPAAVGWPVPALPTPGALADWLGLRPNELDWFADLRGLQRRTADGPLRHYAYRWLERPGRRPRLLEVPRSRLRAIQRRLLHDLLDNIPPHDAAHGYRRGRSTLSCASPHVGRRVVVRFDLRDFFASVRASRVFALFRTAGYPEGVARLLTGLCTNTVPDAVLRSAPRPCAEAYARFRQRHLPQGAPTSPALANLCAYRLDCRLAGLAAELGAAYTRYADDLTFSGGEDFERSVRRLNVLVCRVGLEEGFEVNLRKTRVMRRSTRQIVLGVVVNERPNVSRTEFDRIKAILCNCVRHGPASQNRAGVADFRAHLLGRVAHVSRLNPGRGAKLRALLELVPWG
jgi:RNA-directed DNA polymerase